MKVDVYDTYVTKKNGRIMHFDIIVPKGTRGDKVLEYGRKYLESVGHEGEKMTARECEFCHSEVASPAIEGSLHEQGFHIVEMEGCQQPEPASTPSDPENAPNEKLESTADTL